MTALTLEETRLIAESLRKYAKLVELVAEYGLVEEPAETIAVVPETMEKLAQRVEAQTAS